MARKTDYEPIAASYDRRYQDNLYPGTEATLRAFVDAGQRVLEVGCGTGHWLEQLELEAGVARIWNDVQRAEARGESLQLKSDLRLWATFGSIA